LRWVVEIGALIGLSSVILVMVIAQPRIFVMGRDGMLPPVFAIRASTAPHINAVITGVSIAALAAVFPLDILGDLSRWELIAFCCVHRRADPHARPPRRTAHVPACRWRRSSALSVFRRYFLLVFGEGGTTGR
jgi:hypothetical protein